MSAEYRLNLIREVTHFDESLYNRLYNELVQKSSLDARTVERTLWPLQNPLVVSLGSSEVERVRKHLGRKPSNRELLRLAMEVKTALPETAFQAATIADNQIGIHSRKRNYNKTLYIGNDGPVFQERTMIRNAIADFYDVDEFPAEVWSGPTLMHGLRVAVASRQTEKAVFARLVGVLEEEELIPHEIQLRPLSVRVSQSS